MIRIAIIALAILFAAPAEARCCCGYVQTRDHIDWKKFRQPPRNAWQAYLAVTAH